MMCTTFKYITYGPTKGILKLFFQNYITYTETGRAPLMVMRDKNTWRQAGSEENRTLSFSCTVGLDKPPSRSSYSNVALAL